MRKKGTYVRKYAILKEPFPLNNYGDMCVKIMIHETKYGVYVYLYTTTDKYQGCSFDDWYEDLKEAEEYGVECGVSENDWIILDELLPDCFPSIVAPVRQKGSDVGESNKNEYEALVDGVWVNFEF